MKPELHEWLGCYDSSWTGIITPESFSHPAKFARGLIERIFDYCLERGYLQKGDRVGDPFGGIGTGGITAAYRGLHWIGCELEPRFVAMANKNFALHRHGWAQTGKGSATIIRGDSRKFAENVAGVVSSPPYAETGVTAGNVGNATNKNWAQGKRLGSASESYGEASGQIGSLKSGQVDSVISSPPFSPPNNQPRIGQNVRAIGGDQRNGYHGDRTQGNIETLKEGTVEAVVSSPPYSDTQPQKFGGGIDVEKLWVRYREQGGGLSLEGFKKHYEKHSHDYGRSYGQISQLKGGSVEGVVSSPPFEASIAKDHRDASRPFIKQLEASYGRKFTNKTFGAGEYGSSQGQIGKESGETYWQAVDAVYRSCFQAIKPGGVIALVVKDYCSKGKRVRLCDDTMRLLEHIGFQPLERIHAMLVSETKHNDLFEGETVTKKQRKSFFRRLYEAKLPEEDERRIDFEEVLIARKP